MPGSYYIHYQRCPCILCQMTDDYCSVARLPELACLHSDRAMSVNWFSYINATCGRCRLELSDVRKNTSGGDCRQQCTEIAGRGSSPRSHLQFQRQMATGQQQPHESQPRPSVSHPLQEAMEGTLQTAPDCVGRPKL